MSHDLFSGAPSGCANRTQGVSAFEAAVTLISQLPKLVA